MNNKIKAVILASALLLGTPLALAQGRQLETVANYENVAISAPAGKAVTAEAVKAAILRAGNAPLRRAHEQWQITEVAPGKLTGRLEVRGKHLAIVDITYSASAFSVKYKDSENLHYGQGMEMERDPSSPIIIRPLPTGRYVIHPYYNRWVKSLVENIQRETQKL